MSRENPLLNGYRAMSKEHEAISNRYLTPFHKEMQWYAAKAIYTQVRLLLFAKDQVPAWSELSEEEQEAYIAQFWWA